MRIVITGGCGFLGRRTALRLLQRADLEELVLVDNEHPAVPLPGDARLRIMTGDIADENAVRQAVVPGTSAVFHLAAVVSGEAEADTDLGYRVNLDGTRAILEACRAVGTRPRVIFASSLAVYGGDLPAIVGEYTPLTPQTSYGTQKAVGELLINDYSRKGFVDGRALRLPTVVVRPGRPNRAASTFASSIIREPLAGREAVCPVSPDTVMALASPRRIVDALLRAHDLPADAFGAARSLQLPGFSVAVGEMAEAVRRAGGDAAYSRIRWDPDPLIQQIVSGWPQVLDGRRAASLGFSADNGIDEVVRAFIEDDLEAQKNLA
jgi:D-erythronate 2-dehydrogenase